MITDFQLLLIAIVAVTIVQLWQSVAIFRLRKRLDELEYELSIANEPFIFDRGPDYNYRPIPILPPKS